MKPGTSDNVHRSGPYPTSISNGQADRIQAHYLVCVILWMTFGSRVLGSQAGGAVVLIVALRSFAEFSRASGAMAPSKVASNLCSKLHIFEAPAAFVSFDCQSDLYSRSLKG